MRELRPAFVLFALFTVLCGLAYPLLCTLLAPAVPHASAAREIGQPFSAPGHFWGRPSAVSYDAKTSSGTNLGPTNPALTDAIAQRVAVLHDVEQAVGAPSDGKVPVDLVTASGSGLDPDISPDAAYYQVARVAAARGLPADEVRRLVSSHVTGRQLLLFGEPRVNVVDLNRALDALQSPTEP
jgi:K+-transporting ATPase ATPase C chain